MLVSLQYTAALCVASARDKRAAALRASSHFKKGAGEGRSTSETRDAHMHKTTYTNTAPEQREGEADNQQEGSETIENNNHKRKKTQRSAPCARIEVAKKE